MKHMFTFVGSPPPKLDLLAQVLLHHAKRIYIAKGPKKKKYSVLKWCSVYSPYMRILESIHSVAILLGKVSKLNLG